MTKQVKILFLTLLFLLCGIAWQFTSCRKTPTEPSQPGISLEAEDVAVTEVWLRVRTQAQSGTIILLRNDSTIVTIPDSLLSTLISGLDTLIVDEGLLPKHTYTYTLTRSLPFGLTESTRLTVTTMSTTSHEFFFQIDTLGEGNSSYLRDITIVNDTLAYAVGEIYKKDSSGNFETEPYNLARWDGKNWELKKIYWSYGGGQGVAPMKSIFAFSENDIWVGSSAPYHWNGHRWQAYNVTGIFNGYINKFWGTSSSNLYMVGMNGNIAHYNGSTWRKIASGTTLDIQDIWGGKNEKTGLWEVLAVAGNYYISNERKILHISGTNVTALSDSGINWALNGVWFSRGKRYWVVGTGIWEKPFSLKTSRWKGGPNIVTTYTTNAIRGTEINNVFICGAFGDLLHFNGVAWHSYRSNTALSAGQYLSIAVNSSIVYAVGYESPRAVVIRGYPLKRR